MDAACIPVERPLPTTMPIVGSRGIEALWYRLSAPEVDALPSGLSGARARALLEDFWRSHPEGLLFERSFVSSQEHVVTFLHRDARAEEVKLTLESARGGERESHDPNATAAAHSGQASSGHASTHQTVWKMRRLPGTDVWHLSFRLAVDWLGTHHCTSRYRGEHW